MITDGNELIYRETRISDDVRGTHDRAIFEDVNIDVIAKLYELHAR